MSIITIITIVLNICQCHFCPMAAGWWSALFWIVAVPCDPHISPVIGCAAMRDRPLCIRCRSVCFSQSCLCVCVNECLKWVRIILDDRCWFNFRGGFVPRGRRFQCCQRFLWRSSVVLMPRALLPSAVFWLLAAACPQPSPHSCLSLLTVWV